MTRVAYLILSYAFAVYVCDWNGM